MKKNIVMTQNLIAAVTSRTPEIADQLLERIKTYGVSKRKRLLCKKATSICNQ